MTAINWQNIEHITVLGLGKSGLSVLRFLQRQLGSSLSCGDVSVDVFDSRAEAPGTDAAIEILGKEQVHNRRWQLEDTLAADLLVISPGIDPRDETIQLAQQAGVPIVGDVELFAQQVDKPVVAITGSNGKSTVTKMVEHIAQVNGVNALAAGNIGLPVLDALEQQPEAYVLELSSFQLETVRSLQPQSATVLNVSPDHLDRYDSETAYRDAKLNIYRGAKTAVVNRSQPDIATIANANVVSFGSNESSQDFGLTPFNGQHAITYQGRIILTAEQLSVQGLHNLLNAQAAMALSMSLGIVVDQAALALQKFEGLPHRCQLVYSRDGVQWVNDSKATNIGATEAAIEGIRPVVNGKLLLIAGGEGKGANFAELQPTLNSVDVLLTIGKDGPRIGQYFNGSRQCKSLEQAVATAASLASKGDMVLLSPACASFDQFDSFEHRGRSFAAAVEAHYEQSA